MSTEIVQHTPTTNLSINTDQSSWTDSQVAALQHMGVEDASPADLGVFFHVVKRTGLDPFARQIHMIGRNSKNQRTQQWETKYTIQTGIDGYRLIGRRAADQTHDTISVRAPQWAHAEGGWRDVWSTAWGHPVAAKVTIYRGGQEFTGVALFDEYRQTKRDGNLTSMWAQRPAGQLAKCAEALAWRMAFPQDLAGIYTHDEMGHADNTPADQRAVTAKATAADFLEDKPPVDVTDAEVVEDAPQQPATGPDGPAKDNRRRALFAAFGKASGFDTDARSAEGRKARLDYIGKVIGREVASSNDLTSEETELVIAALTDDADQSWTSGDRDE